MVPGLVTSRSKDSWDRVTVSQCSVCVCVCSNKLWSEAARVTHQFVQSCACRPRQQKYNAVPAQAHFVCVTLCPWMLWLQWVQALMELCLAEETDACPAMSWSMNLLWVLVRALPSWIRIHVPATHGGVVCDLRIFSTRSSDLIWNRSKPFGRSCLLGIQTAARQRVFLPPRERGSNHSCLQLRYKFAFDLSFATHAAEPEAEQHKPEWVDLFSLREEMLSCYPSEGLSFWSELRACRGADFRSHQRPGGISFWV